MQGILYILAPLVFAIMAVSIPQILIREDHPKLETRIIWVRRGGYAIIALIILLGIFSNFL